MSEQVILKKALAFYAKVGIEGFSMGPLAKYCDMGVANIYHYFGNRLGLLNAMYLEAYKLWGKSLAAEANTVSKGAKAKFLHLWSGSVLFFSKHPGFSKLLLTLELEGIVDETTRKAGRSQLNMFTEILEKGIAKGNLDTNLDLEVLLQYVLQSLLIADGKGNSNHIGSIIYKGLKIKK